MPLFVLEFTESTFCDACCTSSDRDPNVNKQKFEVYGIHCNNLCSCQLSLVQNLQQIIVEQSRLEVWPLNQTSVSLLAEVPHPMYQSLRLVQAKSCDAVHLAGGKEEEEEEEGDANEDDNEEEREHRGEHEVEEEDDDDDDDAEVIVNVDEEGEFVMHDITEG